MRRARRFCTLCLGLALTDAARAGEDDIVRRIEQFFATGDIAARRPLVDEILADPAYERAGVVSWLNAARLFEPLDAGVTEHLVPIGNNVTRTIVLRIPDRYDPAAPMPLIYALHGTGGSGRDIIRYLEHILGPRIEEFLVAAPTAYDQIVIASEGPPSAEHLLVLTAIRRKLHVQSDRVFCTGYSRGGHASWTLGVLHADQFAGVMPLAGTFHLIGIDALWDAFLPNIAGTHVLHVWGAADNLDDGGRTSAHGGIAGVSRLLRERVEALKLPADCIELPDKGHGDVAPPSDLLTGLLGRQRTQYPQRVRQTVRFPYQARAYWLEAHAWRGAWWDNQPHTLELRPNEDPREAYHRDIRSRLGELSGEIDHQTIDVRRKKITEMTIWIGDGMIDWSQPVTIKVSGRTAYEGRIKPDLYVCLAEAARTYDLQRLRWAGLRFISGKKARLVDGETPFPPLGEEIMKE